MADLRWYAARAMAMSPPEIAWRTRSVLRESLGGRTLRVGEAADFVHSRLRELVLDVSTRECSDPVETAERIARGELSFWGRRVNVDPQQIAWNVDPLTAQPWEGAGWRHSGRDPKPVWELNHQQHLIPLAVGSALAHRADWGRLVIEQALSWNRANPVGQGIAWTSAYEVSHRLLAWVLAIPLVVEHGTRDELDQLGGAVAEHRAFVHARPSRYSSANNHRLVELTGLLGAALLTRGEPRFELLWAELEHEAVAQTYADGGSREQAAGYFLYALEILSVAALLASARSHELGRIAERLRAMLQWLAAVADDDWEPPPVGDDAEDRVCRVDYFEPRRAAVIASRVAAILDIPLPPRETSSVVVSESGYAILRTEDARVVFDVGELGFGTLAAHGHADALSVLVDVGGRSVLRDTGTGSYVEGRDADRATAFHNTVTVGERSQAEPRGRHLWGRRYRMRLESAVLRRESDYVRATVYLSGGTTHTRSVVRLPENLLVVIDRVRARRAVSAELVWQPGPGVADEVSVAAEPAATKKLVPGRYSRRYTWIEDAVRLVWRTAGRDVIFASAVPLDTAARPSISLIRRGASAVEVAVPGYRIVEDWRSDLVEVRAATGR